MDGAFNVRGSGVGVGASVPRGHKSREVTLVGLSSFEQ